jgi:hypothetical protein
MIATKCSRLPPITNKCQIPWECRKRSSRAKKIMPGLHCDADPWRWIDRFQVAVQLRRQRVGAGQANQRRARQGHQRQRFAQLVFLPVTLRRQRHQHAVGQGLGGQARVIGRLQGQRHVDLTHQQVLHQLAAVGAGQLAGDVRVALGPFADGRRQQRQGQRGRR